MWRGIRGTHGGLLGGLMLLMLCWAWGGRGELVWPTLYMNSDVSVVTVYRNRVVEAVGYVRWDGRELPYKYVEKLIASGAVFEELRLVYSSFEHLYRSNDVFCINDTYTQGGVYWRACSQWTVGNPVVSNCVFHDGEGQGEVNYTVWFDVNQKVNMWKSEKVVEEHLAVKTVKIGNPQASPPTASDFVVPTLCQLN